MNKYEYKYLTLLKQLVLKQYKPYRCRIFLFGSRAKGFNKRGSDYDIGISGLDSDMFHTLKSRLLYEVEESIIPYRLDIVNFDEADENFKEKAMGNIKEWKKF
ncbi:MAG: nucleotidyltransferase domain-containing protein [Brevinematales bacterium]|jgi:predicted nucleotidyltransferase